MNLVAIAGAVGFLAAGYYRPRFRQRLLREGLAADLLHAFVNGVLLDIALAFLLRSIALGLAQVTDGHWLRVLSDTPLWQQALVLLVAGDLLKWLTHRLQHAIPLLWRLHRLHHSSQELDALSHARSHPLESLINRLPFLTIFVLMLGIDLRLIAVFSTVDLLQGLWAHSNTHVQLGWVNYLFATQEFHHWHHADDRRAIDKNFGGFLSIWDWIFGTAYCPHDGTIQRFGLADTKSPRTYIDHVRLRF